MESLKLMFLEVLRSLNPRKCGGFQRDSWWYRSGQPSVYVRLKDELKKYIRFFRCFPSIPGGKLQWLVHHRTISQ